MAAQLMGVIGLTCAAPSAYYIGAGRLNERALVLWAANWAFAGNQIHFVQLRIHAARAAISPGKFVSIAFIRSELKLWSARFILCGIKFGTLLTY